MVARDGIEPPTRGFSAGLESSRKVNQIINLWCLPISVVSFHLLFNAFQHGTVEVLAVLNLLGQQSGRSEPASS
jgi:hypothetical protein